MSISFKHKYSDHHNTESIKVFGFWIYLMSDCILFCCLFAVYSVLINNSLEESLNKDIFNISTVLVETILLLCSSITCSISTIILHNRNYIMLWLTLTWLFGAGFVGTEIYELCHLIMKGFKPSSNGFASAFFTIISTHGIHVIFGLIWIIVLMLNIFYDNSSSISAINRIRLICLNLFWHFLDIIWICVFSVVYLIGRT